MDTLDQLRVKTTRFVASRLEMITPVELASNFETFYDKTADAAEVLSERLRSIHSSNHKSECEHVDVSMCSKKESHMTLHV